MHVVIAGAGEVGGHAAEVLSSAGYSVTVIDLSSKRTRLVGDHLDVRTVVGHCGHLDVLVQAGCNNCDLFVAATEIDEINLLAAALAKQLGTKKTIVRVHHTANFALAGTEVARGIGVNDMLCPEHLTALEIARAIRNPGSIALEEFSRGQLLMQRFAVTAGASAIGKQLSEITLPASTRIATIENKGGPSIGQAKSVIAEGDLVTVIGETKSFDAARKLFSKEKEKKRYVAIMGDSATAVWLSRVLKSRFFSVRLFVHNMPRAEELAAKLDHVTVLVADPTDKGTFSDEQIDKADVFVAATGDDEDNIMACAQAKALGTAMAIAVVQRAKYMHLFAHVGIDFAYSPRSVAVNTILSLIDIGPIRSVAKFAEDTTEVYEIHPHKKAKIIGHELRNIKMPPQSMIAALRREDHAYIPGADDEVAPGDVLLVIAPADTKDNLRKLFVTK
ncbi:MAG: Trk system potassium transporter TrkA [Planctomycetota bacterium]|jgi:trk system potassium uptake protein TrkA